MTTFVRVDGRRVIAYDAIGAGHDLVCIPGGPGYGGDQLARLGGLTVHRRLLRLDLRGAGMSDAPVSQRYGFADYAADIDLMRRHLGVDRIDLFGHAHGGLSAAWYAREHPDRVGALILDGVPVRPVHEFDTGSEQGVPDYFEDYDSRASHYVGSHMSRIHEPAMAWFWDHESGTDFRALIRDVDVPTLLITGEHDPMAGEAPVMSLAATMKQARAVAIPAASHFAWVENPFAYTAAIEDFLTHAVVAG